MKTRFFRFTSLALASAAMLAAACSRDHIDLNTGGETGTLSFGSLALSVSQEVEEFSRATDPLTANYTVRIYNSSQVKVGEWVYSAMPSDVALQVGDYTIVIQSLAEVPVASFETPVYGARKSFTIEANKTTQLGQIVCTLVNIKVSVSYSDDMLAVMGDDCKAIVELGTGLLEFPKGEQRAGYFAAAAESNTMVIKFSGTVDGSYATQTKAVSGVQAGQWRRVRFVKVLDPEGNASFDIRVSDWVEEGELGGNVNDGGEVMGPDPGAPDVPGGNDPQPSQSLSVSYNGGAVPAEPIVVGTLNTPTISSISFDIAAPRGIQSFVIEMSSANASLNSIFIEGNLSPMNLISPTADQQAICDQFRFPYGNSLVGQTSLAFDLKGAMNMLCMYEGVHTFTLVISDGTDTIRTPILMQVNP